MCFFDSHWQVSRSDSCSQHLVEKSSKNNDSKRASDRNKTTLYNLRQYLFLVIMDSHKMNPKFFISPCYSWVGWQLMIRSDVLNFSVPTLSDQVFSALCALLILRRGLIQAPLEEDKSLCWTSVPLGEHPVEPNHSVEVNGSHVFDKAKHFGLKSGWATTFEFRSVCSRTAFIVLFSRRRRAPDWPPAHIPSRQDVL